MTKHVWLGIALALMIAVGSSGCREEGAAEKLGRQLDEAAENAGEAIEDAADETRKKLQ